MLFLGCAFLAGSNLVVSGSVPTCMPLFGGGKHDRFSLVTSMYGREIVSRSVHPSSFLPLLFAPSVDPGLVPWLLCSTQLSAVLSLPLSLFPAGGGGVEQHPLGRPLQVV